MSGNSAIPSGSMPKVRIPDRLYFRIGDVATLVGVKPYVLRYWESEFPIISPTKSGSGQRVYRRSDVESLLMIKHLLYQERYSIEGAKKRIRDLRKEGDLKNFKQEKVADVTVQVSPEEEKARRERIENIQALARELKALAKLPIRKLFEY
jgi:DNA-binding transcriptional MerR regulator